MPDEVTIATPPDEGVWRVARGPDPLVLRDQPDPITDPTKADRAMGNRYDRAVSDYHVRYFATARAGCYGETLATFRPDPGLLDVDDRDEGQMGIGEMPADWRANRVAIRASFPEGRPFLDVEHAVTRATLRGELAWLLKVLNCRDLDVSDIRSGDRRLTRWVSEWAWDRVVEGNVPFAGIRFVSRHNSDWECWAVFDDVVLEVRERIPILPTDDDLRAVARLYKLTIF
jgi:hypothetical protein